MASANVGAWEEMHAEADEYELVLVYRDVDDLGVRKRGDVLLS